MRTHWEALHQSLGRSIHTLKSLEAFRQMKSLYPTFAALADPGAVVAHLTSRDGDLDEKDQLLAALVTAAQRRQHQRLPSTLLWLGLWPGLDAAYRRCLRHFMEAPEELVSELALAFTSLVESLDFDSTRRVAATLVRSTERAVMHRKKRTWVSLAWGGVVSVRWMGHHASAPWPESALGMSQGSCLGAELETLRARLGRLVGADADLLLLVVVLQHTQKEAGIRLGLSHAAARKRFQRGLRRIRHQLAVPLSPSEGADVFVTRAGTPSPPGVNR